MGEKAVRTCRQSGRTLTYVHTEERAETGSSLASSTHSIVVGGGNWTYKQHVLLWAVCFLSVLIMMTTGGAGDVFQPWLLLGAPGSVYWAKRRRRRTVVKEELVVMPSFGVQLETVFHGGHVHRRFVPLQKIAAPVINEAVSPMTCSFYLALLLRGEEDMLLTFRALRPPLKMLVPIWSSLCLTLGTELHGKTV